MSDWPALPLFFRVAGQPVILLGNGPAAAAKRRLLERAGAVVTDTADAPARLAIVAIEDDEAAAAAVARLRARGVAVNAVDRPDLCDFTLPAIVDRAPLLIAVGTGGVSAGLAAAVRQRLEAALHPMLGTVARRLHAMRNELRDRFPDGAERRRAISAALAPGGAIDDPEQIKQPDWLQEAGTSSTDVVRTIMLTSDDPDELTLRHARWLANADRILHDPDVPPSILTRARADAERIKADEGDAGPGLTVVLRMAS